MINKKLAKNTALLYARTFVILPVSLYTSRIVLRVLGVEDFGLYALIAGIVVLFSFINGALQSGTQRFLSFELGCGSTDEAAKVFAMSLRLHLLIVLATAALAETVGLWIVDTYLVIPPERLAAAKWLYQFTILAFCANILRAPYNATIIAYEKMSFYAAISIVEAALKLGLAFCLTILPGDKLILYGLLLGALYIVLLLVTAAYNRRHFPVCRYRRGFDPKLLRKLAGFSGWSLFGYFANAGAQQGIQILLNMFAGVVANAAAGIAAQVGAAVYTFVANFQTAFHPQLVKHYSRNDQIAFLSLIHSASRISFMLIWIFALPVLVHTEYLIGLWLGEVPAYVTAFTRLTILFAIVDAIGGPLWLAVQATGNIRNYQIIISSIVLINLPLSYALLKSGCQPESVFAARVAINIASVIVRIAYLGKHIELHVSRFLKEVAIRSAIVTILSLIPILTLCRILHPAASVAVSVACCAVVILFAGLEPRERNAVFDQIKKRIK